MTNHTGVCVVSVCVGVSVVSVYVMCVCVLCVCVCERDVCVSTTLSACIFVRGDGGIIGRWGLVAQFVGLVAEVVGSSSTGGWVYLHRRLGLVPQAVCLVPQAVGLVAQAARSSGTGDWVYLHRRFGLVAQAVRSSCTGG